MKKLILFFAAIFLTFFISSCTKDSDFGEVTTEKGKYIFGKGVFIINEGNYGQGNGSISFYNFYTNIVYNGIFESINMRPLGDVPVSAEIINNLLYIIVNNSGKIEVVNLSDFKSLKTISGLNSPRYLLPISNQKTYISDLRSNSLSVLNNEDNNVIKTIYCGKSTDRMLLFNNRVFVCNWSEYYIKAPNNTIQVIDALTDKLIDSVKVGKEPNSLALDKYNRLWVLSSGGYNNDEFPELNCINAYTLQIEKKIIFPNKNQSPTSLCINNTGDTIYFINQNIYRMSVNDNKLPLNPFIFRGKRLFYNLMTTPNNNYLWLSDAIDYNQNGFIYKYSPDGTVTDSVRTGIIPSYFLFTK